MKQFVFFLYMLIFCSCGEENSNNSVFISTQISLDEYIEKYAISSNLLIGHTSDIHAYRANWDSNLIRFFDLFSQEKFKSRVDALLLTGDYCDGTGTRDKMEAINEIKSVFNIVLSQEIPCYAIIGNHDDNVEMCRGKMMYIGNTQITKQEQLDLIIHPILRKWNPFEDCNTAYYKIDFQVEKVRMIFLDFIDYPYELDCDGYMRHNIGFYFSQEQLEWLYETLLTTPNDYGVCVVIHGIPTSEFQIGEYAQGINLLPNIINAYKNGTVFNHIWSHPDMPEFSTHINFDFTSKGTSDFICYLGGHVHTRNITTIDKYSDQIMITAPCLCASNTNNLFNIVSINTHLRELVLFGYDDNNEDAISSNIVKVNY